MADTTLETGRTALEAGKKKLDIISDNLANLSSPGFKQSRVDFTDAFSQTLKEPSASSGSTGSNTPAMQVGTGTKIGNVRRDFGQGPLDPSNDPAHLGVEGNGWFQVENSLNNEKFASRDGSFRVDDQKYFVTKQGFRLQGAIFDPTVEPTYTVEYVSGELVYNLDTPGAAASPTIGALNTAFSLTVGSGLTKGGSVPGGITDAEIEAGAPRLQSYSFNDKGVLQIQLSR